MKANTRRTASKKSIFLFRSRSPLISRAGLYFKLCGYRGERITITPLGEAVPKTYAYDGIPHVKLGDGAILVDGCHVRRIEELFKKYQVSYLKITPRSLKNHNFL